MVASVGRKLHAPAAGHVLTEDACGCLRLCLCSSPSSGTPCTPASRVPTTGPRCCPEPICRCIAPLGAARRATGGRRSSTTACQLHSTMEDQIRRQRWRRQPRCNGFDQARRGRARRKVPGRYVPARLDASGLSEDVRSQEGWCTPRTLFMRDFCTVRLTTLSPVCVFLPFPCLRLSLSLSPPSCLSPLLHLTRVRCRPSSACAVLGVHAGPVVQRPAARLRP